MKDFIDLLKDYEYRIIALERAVTIKDLQIPSDGSFVLPNYTADPASPIEGQMWRNTTSNQIKVRNNGVTRVVNTTP